MRRKAKAGPGRESQTDQAQNASSLIRSIPLPAARDVEIELHDWCASCYADPLAFVVGAYSWPIHGEPGPDVWQAEFLKDIGRAVAARGFDGVHPVPPILKGIASGHGIGKGALFAWIVNWIMSTRRNAQGTVTANTQDQLEKKTWAAIRYWTSLCLTSHWFEINSAIMFRKGFRASWFCSPQSCKEENSEAFAGQHAKTSTSFYIFDEASAIPASIWQVAEGGLTDGEPMWLVGGNPTRSSGAFHQAIFGTGRDRWSPVVIDARTCKLPNQALIAEWIAQEGEDSDFVRVRVRGLPPRASDLQFIDQDRIWVAQRRPLPAVVGEAPLIAGVDVSGGGEAWNVVRFRRGLDARSYPPIRIPGEATRSDRSAFLGRLAELCATGYQGQPLAMMFVDSAYGAPYVERLTAMGHRNVTEVNFEAKSLDVHQANQRAYMWNRLKEWLLQGVIDPRDTKLETDLTAPGQHLNKKDQLVLEAKEQMQKRGVASPDDADALALTFAASVQVAPRVSLGRSGPVREDAWLST